jgi:cation diffusion facilitator CzcD-associated flavoprotein CzcO
MDATPSLYDPPIGLDALERTLTRDLALLQLPPANWTAPTTGPDGAAMPDVVIVGAGMSGIAAAVALRHKGLHNILLLDRSPAGREGPWVTTARMTTLRSPKHLPGIPIGLPALTFRAWYEAQHGAAGWEALYKIPNHVWQAYLAWIRTTLALPYRSGTELLSIRPGRNALALRVRDAAAEQTIHARRVVLATGRGGVGGLYIPDFIDPALWPDRAAHAYAPIDFGSLKGRDIAVIGAGPAGWDNASTALEHGAAGATLYCRRAQLPQINKGRGSAGPGYFEGWAALDPAQKWSLLVYMTDLQAPPPHESVLRALAHPGFRIRLGAPVLAARRSAEGVSLTIGPDGQEQKTDFLIAATGFAIDLARVPELSHLQPHIACWADRYEPEPELRRPSLARLPWLGDGFECMERHPGECPALNRLHLFNHGAMASLGAIASDIPGISTGAERLASRIAQHFFREDFAAIRNRLDAFDEPELQDTPFFIPRG